MAAIPFLSEIITALNGVRFGSSTGPFIRAGTGSPEGVVTAPIGSRWLRSDGGTNTASYRKETGVGNTGWVADAAGGGAAVGVHAPDPALIAGAYITAATNAGAFSTVASAAGRLDFYPFIPFVTRTVNELSIEVTTLLAASQARVGIYSSNAGGLPDALLTGAGALLDCASLGQKVSPVAPSATLTAGTVYWLAVHTSATQTLRGIAVASMMTLGAPATGTTLFNCRRATVLFTSGLPVTAPATVLTSAIMPVIKLRLA